MAGQWSAGLSPAELAFLCELELVTVIPRQRLESLPLLGGSSVNLRPPHRADVPLWLALLLKRQRRADIVPPAWLSTTNLEEILNSETADRMQYDFTTAPSLSSSSNTYGSAPTPPFAAEHIAAAKSLSLPYHWLEMGQTLLDDASDDIPEAESVRRLLRDLREVRMAKVRTKIGTLDGGAGVQMSGLGAMEIGESRTLVGGIIDNMRILGASREQAEQERAEEEGNQGLGNDNEDEDML